MLLRSVSGGVLLALSLALAAPVARADDLGTISPDTLTTCLPRNSGVIAGLRHDGGSGFDYRISQELARRLGLDLEVVWYESELEERSDPIRETYAMLAFGLCDVVPGYPRYAAAVGPQDFDRAALPRWVDMPQEVDRETGYMKDRNMGFVDVRPVTVSRGYMRSEIGLVYAAKVDEPKGLDDLSGRTLAVQQGTLAGAIAMLQTDPAERALIHTYNPDPGFLWKVEGGGADMAIVDVLSYDSFRKSNTLTKLELADWRHPIGMDIGVAVLKENAPLLGAVDAALADIIADGTAARMAGEEGVTYAPPQSDTLAPPLTRAALVNTR